ncbi:MAG: HAD hydrolase family protein [Clostridiales bacterium]|nr:HAD hydrolase family protein [Clostridiales bacterium]
MNISNILIVTDIDNTFLGDESVLPEENAEAVKRFIAAGGHFTFATGRYEPSFAEGVPCYRELMNAPGIFCNGAYCRDFYTKEFIDTCPLEPLPALKLSREMLAAFPDIDSRLTCEKGLFYLREKGRDIPDSELPTDEPWYKIIFMGDPDRLDEARDFMIERSGSRYAFSKSYPEVLEILEAGATKGSMLRSLKKHMEKKLGRPLEVWACGDFENDLPMLEAADVACCPSNALEEVQALSEHVLSPNNQGFMAEMIELIMNTYPAAE